MSPKTNQYNENAGLTLYRYLQKRPQATYKEIAKDCKLNGYQAAYHLMQYLRALGCITGYRPVVIKSKYLHYNREIE